MNGIAALARMETLNDRISALGLAEQLFTEKGRGTGELIDMRREMVEERDELIEKLRAVKL